MKKFIIVLFILAVISPVFAQNNPPIDDMYYVNVSVERVYPTSQGYVIRYMKNSGVMATIGIPNDWFYTAAGKAEVMNLQPGTDWPTMSIFYRNGEFSHVRLYLHRYKGHQTWGNIPQGTDVSRFFPTGDVLNIEY